MQATSLSGQGLAPEQMLEWDRACCFSRHAGQPWGCSNARRGSTPRSGTLNYLQRQVKEITARLNRAFPLCLVLTASSIVMVQHSSTSNSGLHYSAYSKTPEHTRSRGSNITPLHSNSSRAVTGPAVWHTHAPRAEAASFNWGCTEKRQTERACSFLLLYAAVELQPRPFAAVICCSDGEGEQICSLESPILI